MARNNQARLVFTRKFLRDVVMPSRKSSGSKPAQGAKKRWCKEVAQPGNKINNGTKAQQQQPKDALGHREGGEGGAGPPTRASGKVLKVFHGKKSTEDDKKPAATRQPARTSPRNKRCLSTTDSSPPLKRLKNLDMGVQEKQKKVEFIQPKVGDRVYCLHSRLGWYWGEATKKFWKQCKLYYSIQYDDGDFVEEHRAEIGIASQTQYDAGNAQDYDSDITDSSGEDSWLAAPRSRRAEQAEQNEVDTADDSSSEDSWLIAARSRR